MHIEFTPDDLFKYMCSECGYEREELLDYPAYSWNCPKCGGYPHTETVKEN